MRNNEERFNFQENQEQPQLETKKPFDFPVQTDFVELPSEGDGYPKGHPFDGKKKVEIYYMSANEEDILTSETLAKENLMFERLIESCLVDKMNASTIQQADRDAILFKIRQTGFGREYQTKVQCPKCFNVKDVSLDLEKDKKVKKINYSKVEKTDRNTFLYKLEKYGIDIELKILSIKDIRKYDKGIDEKLGHETKFTDKLRAILVSVDGCGVISYLDNIAKRFPTIDAIELLQVYNELEPSVKLEHEYKCDNVIEGEKCDYKGPLEVPLDKNFFWPEL